MAHGRRGLLQGATAVATACSQSERNAKGTPPHSRRAAAAVRSVCLQCVGPMPSSAGVLVLPAVGGESIHSTSAVVRRFTGASAVGACLALTGNTTLYHLDTGAAFSLQGAGAAQTTAGESQRAHVTRADCGPPLSATRARVCAGTVVFWVPGESAACPSASAVQSWGRAEREAAAPQRAPDTGAPRRCVVVPSDPPVASCDCCAGLANATAAARQVRTGGRARDGRRRSTWGRSSGRAPHLCLKRDDLAPWPERWGPSSAASKHTALLTASAVLPWAWAGAGHP